MLQSHLLCKKKNIPKGKKKKTQFTYESHFTKLGRIFFFNIDNFTGHARSDCPRMYLKRLHKVQNWHFPNKIRQDDPREHQCVRVCQLSLSQLQFSTQRWRECRPHWNAIKAARLFFFFKDSTLWSHSAPLHYPPLSHYASLNEKKKKGGGTLSFWRIQQQHTFTSWGDCYCIAAKPVPPEDIFCVYTAQIAIPPMNRVEVGTNQKSSMICLINFFADK